MEKGERFLEPVMLAMKQCFQRYSHSLPTFAEIFSSSIYFRAISRKKIRNDGIDVFEDHVDVQDTLPHVVFVTCLFYLNTVEEGGEAKIFFPNEQNKLIKPIQGQVAVFFHLAVSTSWTKNHKWQQVYYEFLLSFYRRIGVKKIICHHINISPYLE